MIVESMKHIIPPSSTMSRGSPAMVPNSVPPPASSAMGSTPATSVSMLSCPLTSLPLAPSPESNAASIVSPLITPAADLTPWSNPAISERDPSRVLTSLSGPLTSLSVTSPSGSITVTIISPLVNQTAELTLWSNPAIPE